MTSHTDSIIHVITPPHATGQVQITVKNVAGESPATGDSGFTFRAPSGITSEQDETLTAAARQAPADGRVQGAAVNSVTDPGLKQCIAEALGNDPTDPIQPAQLAGLTSLYCSDRGIASLDGLQGAVALRSIDISRNVVSSLAPLAGLRGLQELWAPGNRIPEITPLGRLAGLRVVVLSDNQIQRLDPLTQAPLLTDLVVDANLVSDLAPLAANTRLVSLDASYNQVASLRPLGKLSALQDLYLWRNKVTDLTPIAGLAGLRRLILSYNTAPTVTPLGKLTGLLELNLAGNAITNVTALAPLTSLQALNLDDNRLRTVAPLARLTKLHWLFLGNNQLTDLSPLSGLTVRTIEAENQQLSLPTSTILWWPVNVRDRNGLAPSTTGADVRTSRILRWPASGRRTATFTNSAATFSGRITQNVRASAGERFGDASGDGWADLFTIRSGRLQLQPGSGSALLPAMAMNGTWTTTTWLGRVHDTNGDKQSDLFTTDSQGRLWMHQVMGPNVIGSSRQIGVGWTTLRCLTHAGRLAGGSAQHFVGIDANGNVQRWSITATGLTSKRTIGRGFANAVALVPVGDWSADGREDLVAIWPTGKMQLFTTTTNGDLVNGRTIGQGWQSMARTFSAGRLSTTAGPDLVAVNSSGTAIVYPNLRGRWGAPRVVGGGLPIRLIG